MNTWVPLWTSTVKSTLWEEPPHVRVMFLTMLLVQDPDHVVRMPFRRLVKEANLAEEIGESARMAGDALKVLGSPDVRSIDNQEFEGRRIREVEDGWLILNGAKYEEQRVKLGARIRKTQKQRERRQMQRGKPLPGEVAGVKAMENGNESELDRVYELSRSGEEGIPSAPEEG